MLNTLDRARAETFVWLNARLIDRLRYTYLFQAGPADAVLAALRPYQNADGGFGNALEPDARGRDSQPTHTSAALVVLDEIGRFDADVVLGALEYLASVTPDKGGVPVALRSIQKAPRAPWWNVEEERPAATLIPTATIAGLLHKNGVVHPWLEAATAFCWNAITGLEPANPYEIDACVVFLEAAPERERAEREAGRLGRLVRERRLVALDPDAPDQAVTPPGFAPGEVHSPLDYAQRPSSLARAWFSEEEITRNLDALVRAQGEDGGWYFNWRDWNTATTLEWRGLVTVRALAILRSYGRLAR